MTATRPTRRIHPNNSVRPRGKAARFQQVATETSNNFETNLGDRGSNAPGSAGDPLPGPAWISGRNGAGVAMHGSALRGAGDAII